MLILINRSFKAMRHGAFVKADESAGEFILNTENKNEHAKSTLVEIAKSNKISVVKKDNFSKLMNALEKGFGEMELPEQRNMSDTDTVKKIVNNGMDKGHSDDDMIVKIIQSGVKYKAAAKMFNQAMADGGFRVSTKERKETAIKIMTDADFEPTEYSHIEKMAEKLVKKISDTNFSRAIGLIRGYCKSVDLEVPKAPKKPRGSFRSKAQNFLLENPRCTKKEVAKWVEAQGKNEKVSERTWITFQFAQKVAEATIAFDLKSETED